MRLRACQLSSGKGSFSDGVSILLPGGRRWLAEGEPDEGVKIKKITGGTPHPPQAPKGATVNPSPLGGGWGAGFYRSAQPSIQRGPLTQFRKVILHPLLRTLLVH